MIKALFISSEEKSVTPVVQILDKAYPDIQISGIVTCSTKGQNLINEIKPDLLFLDDRLDPLLKLKTENFGEIETILLHPKMDDSPPLRMEFPSNTIALPICLEEVVLAINIAKNNIAKRRNNRAIIKPIIEKEAFTPNLLPQNELIGIPTIEGMEILNTNEIIRCEGLQKCTRIVVLKRSNIISSYNLGEFKKLLQIPYFFSPHKSYLINLRFVQKYLKEGSILMADNKWVPVSRRNKKKFLDCILHV